MLAIMKTMRVCAMWMFGAALLAPFFPPIVVECVRLHVAAKRYLVATDGGYGGVLTNDSVVS